MNIELQMGALVLTLILLCFFLCQKKVGLFSEKLFSYMLIATVVATAFDIISTAATTGSFGMPEIYEYALCKAYLVTQSAVPFLALLYTSYYFYGADQYHKSTILVKLMYLVSVLLIVALPLEFYHEGRFFYTYGMSVSVSYIFALAYVMIIIGMLVINGGGLNKRRTFAISMWIVVWLCSAAVQFLFPKVLLLSFSCAISVTILYTMIENPESNLDKITGDFSANSLFEYTHWLYTVKKQFSSIHLALSNDESFYAFDDEKWVLGDISAYLNTFENAKVFRNIGREFAVIFPYGTDVDKIAGEIFERFDRPWDTKRTNGANVLLFPKIYVTKDSMLTGTSERFLALYRYASVATAISEGGIIEIDRALYNEYANVESVKDMVRRALDEDRVTVYYQPIYSVESKKMVAAEALARIVEGEDNIILPGRFIPYVEHTHLINEIGERVFEKNCEFMHFNNMENIGIELMEVNLSVAQCEREDFPDVYMDMVSRYGIEPYKVSLEVTESASLRLRQRVMNNMQKLTEYGISFTLDDFGSGESNLNYIVDMPVSIIKIDREMTRAYLTSEKARVVLDNVSKMVKQLNLKLVAEGVETRDELNAMKNLGVDYIQGFYFSKPLPPLEFVSFVKQFNS